MSRIAWSLLLVLATAGHGARIDPTLLQALGNVQYHRFESAGLERALHVFVRLPEEYDDGDESFPTVFLLDGGLTFPLLSGYYRYLVLGKEIPPCILVGISYGTDDWQEGNLRSTDFTAASAEREFWGGAGRFQQMLAAELLPFVESSYRTDPGRRILFGQSLGGQFVLYTAQTRPQLFWGHLASNPALHRNLEFFLTTRPQGTISSPSRLFVAGSSNDAEAFQQPRSRWIAYWTEQETLPWELEIRTLEGHSHFSAVPAAFRQGMIWLFADERTEP